MTRPKKKPFPVGIHHMDIVNGESGLAVVDPALVSNISNVDGKVLSNGRVGHDDLHHSLPSNDFLVVFPV